MLWCPMRQAAQKEVSEWVVAWAIAFQSRSTYAQLTAVESTHLDKWGKTNITNLRVLNGTWVICHYCWWQNTLWSTLVILTDPGSVSMRRCIVDTDCTIYHSSPLPSQSHLYLLLTVWLALWQCNNKNNNHVHLHTLQVTRSILTFGKHACL